MKSRFTFPRSTFFALHHYTEVSIPKGLIVSYPPLHTRFLESICVGFICMQWVHLFRHGNHSIPSRISGYGCRGLRGLLPGFMSVHGIYLNPAWRLCGSLGHIGAQKSRLTGGYTPFQVQDVIADALFSCKVLRGSHSNHAQLHTLSIQGSWLRLMTPLMVSVSPLHIKTH